MPFFFFFWLQRNYESYDGFVILHGTDTMAYTASALSFMCEHLGKPIILTGSQVRAEDGKQKEKQNVFLVLSVFTVFLRWDTSCLQVPIYEMRNDGRDNLLGALLIAGQFVIPEVREPRWHLSIYKIVIS